MTSERWERVTALYQAALECSEDERETFLRRACGGDEALQNEVRSLLRFGTAAAAFLEQPAVQAVPQLPSSAGGTPATRAAVGRLHPFRVAIVAASALPFGAALVAGAAIWQHAGQRQDLGWTGSTRSAIVSDVTPGGPADGKLQVGDRVIAIDGDPRVSELGVTWKARSLRPEVPYRVDFYRDGQRHQTTLQYRVGDFGDSPLFFCRLLVAVTWMVVGLYIGLARPSLAAARLTAFTGLSVGLELTRAAMLPVLPVVGEASARLYGLMLLNTPALAVLPFHAVYRFPPGVRRGRLWSTVLVALYGAAAFRVVLSLLIGAKHFAGRDIGLILERTLNPTDFSPLVVSAALDGTAALMTGAVAIRNLQAVSGSDERRRVKWILFSIVPATLAVGLNAVLTPGRTGTTMDVVSDLTSLVVPLAFSYSILRHRVFDISIVVRLGIQYMLAKNALRAVIVIPAVLMIIAVATNPDATVRDVLFGRSEYPILILTASAALTFRKRLTTTIDRRFFREAYDRERLLQAILDDIDAFETSEGGVRQVVERLDAALHPTCIQIWFTAGERERLHLSHSHGAQSSLTGRECLLPATLVHLLEHDAATAVSSLPAEGVVGDVRWRLQETGVESVIPMLGRDGRLRGALMLGAKRSEEPYTPADLELLQRIARQLGAVREHAELLSLVDEESRIRHEVLGRIGQGRISLLKECPRCGACYDGDKERCDNDGGELTLSLPIARTIAGRYQLARLIGHGGMGAVYEAVDERLRRQVAVKVMLGRNFGNRDALRRFDREARAVARLSHPNIIAVFDYGALAGDGAFLVMEYVKGTTLRSVLGSTPAHPAAGCLTWIEQLLAGVGAAHAHGVVHRDLKPENVLVITRTDAAERIKVLDFGLATFRGTPGADTASVTVPGMILGTLAYMAPEQMLGQLVEERADIFSLGVIIAEVVTGEQPFSANPLTRGAEIARGLPDGAFGDRQLRDVLARYLDADPARRYASIVEGRDALLPVLRRFLARQIPPQPQVR